MSPDILEFYGYALHILRFIGYASDVSDLRCLRLVSGYWLSDHECNDWERPGDSESFLHTVW